MRDVEVLLIRKRVDPRCCDSHKRQQRRIDDLEYLLDRERWRVDQLAYRLKLHDQELQSAHRYLLRQAFLFLTLMVIFAFGPVIRAQVCDAWATRQCRVYYFDYAECQGNGSTFGMMCDCVVASSATLDGIVHKHSVPLHDAGDFEVEAIHFKRYGPADNHIY
jgi:hypothetical protein